MPALTKDDKSKISLQFESTLSALAKGLELKRTQRDIEQFVAKQFFILIAFTLGVVFSRRCAEETDAALAEHGLTSEDVAMRRDAGYTARMTSIFGPIIFCMHAFRSPLRALGNVGSTVVPAQANFMPLYSVCRSTQLCLEWETRMGADHPFRIAQDELKFVTHNAVTVEDNTIARHMVNASQALERKWLYSSTQGICHILRTRAMYDLKTGRPVVYISSDAHALRRYVDDTWARQWKMANGIRIWAVDRATGENIHLGGEFTWGDCAKVAEIFAELIKMGILPKGGIYGDDLRAQFVWLSDGAPWFRERVIPLFEGGIIEILDLYHVLEHASRYADEALPKSQKKAWLERFKQVLFVTETQPSLELSVIAETPRRLELVEPKLASSQNVPKINPPRKGNRKTFDTDRKRRKLFDIAARAQRLASVGTATERLALIFPANGSGANEDTQIRAQADFMRYLGNNDDRIDYAEMQSRGLQIGSGAMESLHRSGSQVRLKRAGATYLLETSQAIFNVRMLRLSGRWDEFWGQENIARKLAESWGLPGTTDESTKAA